MDFPIVLTIVAANVFVAWGFIGMTYVLSQLTTIERENHKWTRLGTGLRVFVWGPFLWMVMLGCFVTNLYVAARRGWRERGNFFVGRKL